MPALVPELEPDCSDSTGEDLASTTDGKSFVQNSSVCADVSPEEATRHTAPAGWMERIQALPKVYGLTEAEKERIDERNKTYVSPRPPGPGNTFANGATIGIVTLFSKIFIRCANRLRTYRLEVLTDAIENRPPNTGLLTVSNHRSVADDPILLAAMLPPRIMLRPGLVRWGLCSADICFQNKWLGEFMTNGKAMPIMRGAGLSHHFVQQASDKLAKGDWLHVYPEGRVVQQGVGYMKRGVGKMLAFAHEEALAKAAKAAANSRGGDLDQVDGTVPVESSNLLRCDGDTSPPAGLPIVIPMYHEGIENTMAQDRETHRLIRMVPEVGHRIYAIVGDPVDMRAIFDRYLPACTQSGGTVTNSAECVELFEALADRMALSIRLLRAELRMRVRAEEGHFLGDQFEVS